MTVKTHPVAMFEQVTQRWVANPDALAWADWVEIPGQPLPSEPPGGPIGATETTWTWAVDLSAPEEAAWDDMIARLAGGGDGKMPTEQAIDDFETTMANFRNRGGTPSDAQRDAAIDAAIDGYRYLRLLISSR